MSCFPPQETRQNSAASIATSSCYSAFAEKVPRVSSPGPGPLSPERLGYSILGHFKTRRMLGASALPTPATAKVGWGRLLAWGYCRHLIKHAAGFILPTA